MRGTSVSMMRSVLTFAAAIMLLGLPGISNAFPCPLVIPAEVQNEPCSHCPGKKQQESCPVSECLLICPYTVEKAAVITNEGFTDAVVSAVQPFPAPVQPPMLGVGVGSAHLTRDFDSVPLYLLNRVLLI